MAISNVVIEKENQRKPAKFVLDHDVNTTYAWGEIQPLQCQCIPLAGTKSSFKISNTVRMFPLVSPTYGTVAYKHYHHFVSFDDIFPKWREMFSDVQTSMIQSSNTTAEGTEWATTKVVNIPNITSDALWYFLTKYSYTLHYTRSMAEDSPGSGTWHSDAQSDWDMATVKGSDIYSRYRQAMFTGTGYWSNPFVIPGVDENTASTKATILNNLYYFAPEEADFTYFASEQSYGNAKYDILFTQKMSPKGRRLYKILHGLGYFIDPSNNLNHRVNQSILPLLAFYKAYYDSFGLPQFENWETTAAYKIIEYYSHNVSGYYTFGPSATITESTDIFKLFEEFFEDLTECWYTDNTTYASMHIGNTDIPNANRDWSFPTLTSQNITQGGSYTTAVSQTSAQIGNATFTGSSFNQFSDELLKKMYLWCNKTTHIGMAIEEQLKIRGYEDFCKKCGTRYIGTTTTYVDINEVTSTSDTANLTTGGANEGRVLGSPAGRGVTYDENHGFSYESDSPGYIISLGTIVPVSKDVQAIDTTLLGTDIYSFYNPMFDALGFESTPRCAIGTVKGTTHMERTDDAPNNIFGMVPRYTGFKTKNSLLNGGFALKSEQSAYAPYTLDRLIYDSWSDISDYTDTTGGFKTNDVKGGFNRHWAKYWSGTAWVNDETDTTLPFPEAGRIWRRTMSQKLFGNLDRIFNQLAYNDWQHPNRSTYDDTFIVHHIVSYDMIAKMAPISLSWNTTEDSTDVDKATEVAK